MHDSRKVTRHISDMELLCHFRAGESHVYTGSDPGNETSVMKNVFALRCCCLSTLARQGLQNLGSDGVAIQGYDPVAFFTITAG